MVASSIVYPLEVVKTMLTVSPGLYDGSYTLCVCVSRRRLARLLQGWFPTLVAMFPYVGIEFMIYETFSRPTLHSSCGGRKTDLRRWYT